MCEIYGFSGKQKKELNSDLREFYSHACDHPNGWGLAILDHSVPEITREVCRADRSKLLSKRLSLPVRAKTALAHIRLATIGSEDDDNCHPFSAVDHSGRSWTLIHNGTIFESDKLNKYVFRQKGETDSERILLYIVDQINEAAARLEKELSAEQRFSVLDRIVGNSSPKNKLNLLIFDGELLYAHTNFKDSLYERKDDDGVTISTRPLTDTGWRPIPFTTLIAYREGERIFTGVDHHHEYIFDPSSYKPLYLAYSGL